jgi:hypothetical protein
MPKFNLSHKEAEALVDYFGAVERIANPGVGLYPNESIPQQSPLDDPFWSEKNKGYVKRLKASGPTKDGPSWYKQRLTEYETPFRLAALQAGQALQVEIDRAKQQKEAFAKEVAAIKEKLKKPQDEAEKIALTKKSEELTVGGKAIDDLVVELEQDLKQTGPDTFKKAWEEKDAYAADAYRLIVNKAMCLGCHEIAGYKSSNPTTQGPPLALAHQRLRPGWVYRWVATPQRHLTYESVMLVNFPKLPPGESPRFQDILAGQPLQQVEAIRDTLMNYPRIVGLPVNQQWNPNLQSSPVVDKK